MEVKLSSKDKIVILVFSQLESLVMGLVTAPRLGRFRKVCTLQIRRRN